MRRRYELSDKQWNRIKDLLPGRQDTVGVTDRKNAGIQPYHHKLLFLYYEGR